MYVSRSHDRRALLAAALFITLIMFPPGRASAWPLNWQDPETVDTGVAWLTNVPASPAAHEPAYAPWSGANRWHVLYAKDGDVWRRIRTASGWQDPERISDDPADSRAPQVAFSGPDLIVVWEDERTGHPEVWARRWNGSTWSAEECLTGDDVPSRFPAIAGEQSDALVVWEEEIPGARRIEGRLWSGGAWGEVQVFSQSPAEAKQPCVTVVDAGQLISERHYFVAWSDTRDSNTSIYMRPWYLDDGLQPEVRVSDIPGQSAAPVLQAGYCCGDNIVQTVTALFENTAPGGVPEVWKVMIDDLTPRPAERLSDDDGIASGHPTVIDYTYSFEFYPPWYTLELYGIASWGESRAGVCHPVSQFGYYGAPESLGDLGASCPSNAVLGSYQDDPNETVAGLWTEQRAGDVVLVLRTGTILSCYGPEIVPPRRFAVGPAGTPVDTVAVMNHCHGMNPVPGVPVSLVFNAPLAWDGSQQHPETPAQFTDENGRTVFSVRAGGCAAGGTVAVKVSGVILRQYTGIISPDLDGNCIVDNRDVNLVRQSLGTSEFCADLDGSGLVTEEDLAIVQAHVGDLCTQLVGVPGVSGAAPSRLQASPNPSSGAVTFRLDLPSRAAVSARIVDAGGRLVRELETSVMDPGARALSWDGLDTAGRPVASGMYFAVVRAGGESLRSPVLVLR